MFISEYIFRHINICFSAESLLHLKLWVIICFDYSLNYLTPSYPVPIPLHIIMMSMIIHQKKISCKGFKPLEKKFIDGK